MSLSVILSAICITCLLPRLSYGQEYLVLVNVPVVVYDVDFSNENNTDYQQFLQDVDDGVRTMTAPWNITDVELWVKGASFEGVELRLAYEPMKVVQGLWLIFNKGFIIRNQLALPVQLSCIVDGKTVKVELGMTRCEIAKAISACEDNTVCVEETDSVYCKATPPITVPIIIITKRNGADTHEIIALGYGAAFIFFLIVFLIVYCWRKGCANYRKQIQNSQRDEEKKEQRANSNTSLPDHIYGRR